MRSEDDGDVVVLDVVSANDFCFQVKSHLSYKLFVGHESEDDVDDVSVEVNNS